MVQRIEPLDAMVDQVRAAALTVAITDVEAIVPLKAMLGAPTDRGAKVELHVAIPDGVVKLALPGAYAVSAQQLMQLQSLNGITALAA